MIHFILHDARDTVAVVVVEGVKAGDELTGWIMDDDRTVSLRARQAIPIGHKIALRDMPVGDKAVKYGIDIGRVVAPIAAGEHAHVHNVKTQRW
ncbi:UxaA family hydrolase [Ramlibacter sp.]|uniref:UxaA family hydrolase n=1 Tax=Ramlibacter sp. TaxID=1917967 RepID=UPI003D14E11D